VPEDPRGCIIKEAGGPALHFIERTQLRQGRSTHENQERDAQECHHQFFGRTALLFGLFITSAPGIVLGEPIEKKGTAPYVTHFVFRPLMSIDVSGVGTVTTLEAVGTTENMKGEKMFDKMSARWLALNVQSGDKKYIDGACVLADNDGDKIFSTFDTRDLDKSQPDMNCGTHIITGGTGKYAGITGSEPFACNSMPALAGEGGYTAMDIPHNTTWEMQGQ
jgi:hypothetical protein